MQDWQTRVVAESNDLDTKIKALTAFVAGSVFASLDKQSRGLLEVQLNLMHSYQTVLKQRIAAFK